MLKDEFSARTLGEKLNGFRSSCGNLLNYDYINIPLVYTQVVTIAVYMFFLSTVLGRQFLDPGQNFEGHSFDTYVPVYTFMQFFFYMGWLKVGENLSNPFGEDDDDFDVCFLLDRNMKVSYIIVDGMHGSCPRATKDLYFNDVVPRKLLYTQASDKFRVIPKHGSGSGTIVDGQDLLLDDADVEWYENSVLVALDDGDMCSAVPGETDEGKRKPPQGDVSSDVLNDVVMQIIPDDKDARKKLQRQWIDGRKTQDQQMQQQRPRWKQGMKKGAIPDGRRNYSVGTLLKRRADAIERTGQQQRLLQQQRQQQQQQQQQQDSKTSAVNAPLEELLTEEA